MIESSADIGGSSRRKSRTIPVQKYEHGFDFDPDMLVSLIGKIVSETSEGQGRAVTFLISSSMASAAFLAVRAARSLKVCETTILEGQHGWLLTFPSC